MTNWKSSLTNWLKSKTAKAMAGLATPPPLERSSVMKTIKEARKAAGLSQQGVTDTLGIPRRTLQDWETGKRTPPGWAEALIIEKLESMGGRQTAEK